ncbi:WG repeat-containing protein [Patescibacteria group bacterium]
MKRIEDQPTLDPEQPISELPESFTSVDQISSEVKESLLRQELQEFFSPDHIGSFHCGRALMLRGDNYFFVNDDLDIDIGNVLGPFDYAEDFSEGLALVGLKHGERDEFGDLLDNNVEPELLFFYIDKNGRRVFDAVYSAAESFSEGLAAVTIMQGNPHYSRTTSGEQIGKMGDTYYINRQGEIVIEGPFIKAGKFKDGIAIVEAGQNCGCGEEYGGQKVINKKGEVLAETDWWSNEFLFIREFDVEQRIVLVTDEEYLGETLRVNKVDGCVICTVEPSGETKRLIDTIFDWVGFDEEGQLTAEIDKKKVMIDENWKVKFVD